MIADVIDLLRCPTCGEALTLAESHVRCGQGHSYDLNRQGCLNLLGGPQPKHADTAPMVAARDQVLSSGLYAPIASALAGLAGRAPTAAGGDVLDLGAGTGYYLAAVLDAAPTARGVAVDISTAAARRAARAHARLGAVIADAWRRLPLASAAFDLAISVFAPRNAVELARLLRPGGLLVTVTPNPGHLAELRAHVRLLEIDPDKEDRLGRSLDSGFALADRTELQWVRDAPATLAHALVQMGPTAFHRDRLAATSAALPERLQLTASVLISSWRRRPERTP